VSSQSGHRELYSLWTRPVGGSVGPMLCAPLRRWRQEVPPCTPKKRRTSPPGGGGGGALALPPPLTPSPLSATPPSNGDLVDASGLVRMSRTGRLLILTFVDEPAATAFEAQLGGPRLPCRFCEANGNTVMIATALIQGHIDEEHRDQFQAYVQTGLNADIRAQEERRRRLDGERVGLGLPPRGSKALPSPKES